MARISCGGELRGGSGITALLYHGSCQLSRSERSCAHAHIAHRGVGAAHGCMNLESGSISR
jgi:hypothetical protein